MKKTLILIYLISSLSADSFIFNKKPSGFGDIIIENNSRRNTLIKTDDIGFSEKYSACIKLDKVADLDNDGINEAIISLYPACGGNGAGNSYMIFYQDGNNYKSTNEFAYTPESTIKLDEQNKSIILVSKYPFKSFEKYIYSNHKINKLNDITPKTCKDEQKNETYKSYSYDKEFAKSQINTKSYFLDIDNKPPLDRVTFQKNEYTKSMYWKIVLNNDKKTIEPAMLGLSCQKIDFLLTFSKEGAKNILCDSMLLQYDGDSYNNTISLSSKETLYSLEFNSHGAILKNLQNPDKTEWLYLGNKCDAFSKVHGKGTWKFDDYEKGTFTIRFNDKSTFPFDNLSDRF